MSCRHRILRCVSLTLHELSKIFSRYLCIAEIVLLMTDENFKLKYCTCVQSYALDTHTEFRLEIFTINVISGIVHCCETILESSRNVSEATPWILHKHLQKITKPYLEDNFATIYIYTYTYLQNRT